MGGFVCEYVGGGVYCMHCMSHNNNYYAWKVGHPGLYTVYLCRS